MSNGTKLKNIYHISDVHIKLNLHEDIIHAFNVLVKTITDTRETSGTILVIAGDIFEHKTHMTQHDSQCFHKIIKMLISANITTIIMPGNHDFERTNGLDLITPLVMNEDGTPIHNNIYCYAKSGVYKHMGVEFHILSPVDEVIPPIENNNTKKIAIVHETVRGGIQYGDVIAKEDRFKHNSFDKYHIVLLGDLHKYQVIGKGKKMAYSGSFVQKDRGEDLVHGYIKWDVQTVSHTFVPIPLNRAHIKIEAFEDKIISAPVPKDIFPKDVTIFHRSCSKAFVDELYVQNCRKGDVNIPVFLKDRNVISIDDKTIVPGKVIIGGEEISRDNLNFDTLDNQLSMISVYLDSIGLGQYKEKIVEIHKLHAKQTIVLRPWKLNWLKWNNISCFHENNFINFDNIHGIGSIVGKNKTGKSSVITALMFCLTGNTGRISASVVDDIINKNLESKSSKKEIGAIIECGFSINKIQYTVHSNLVDNNDTYILQDGIKIAHNRIETNKILKSLLGVIEIFKMVPIKIQDAYGISDMKDTTLVKQFDNILGLNCLKEIEKKASNTVKLINKNINLKKGAKTRDISVVEAEIKSANEELVQLYNSKFENTAKISKYKEYELKYAIPQEYRDVEETALNVLYEKLKVKIDLLRSKFPNLQSTDSENIAQLLIGVENQRSLIYPSYLKALNKKVKIPDEIKTTINLNKEEIEEKIKILESKLIGAKPINNNNLTDVEIKLERIEGRYRTFFNLKPDEEIDTYSVEVKYPDCNNYTPYEFSDYENRMILNYKNLENIKVKRDKFKILMNENKKVIDLIKIAEQNYENAQQNLAKLSFNNECPSCVHNSKKIDDIVNIKYFKLTLDELYKKKEEYEKYVAEFTKYEKYVVDIEDVYPKYIMNTEMEESAHNIYHNKLVKIIMSLRSDRDQINLIKNHTELNELKLALNNFKYRALQEEQKILQKQIDEFSKKIAEYDNNIQLYKSQKNFCDSLHQLNLMEKTLQNKDKLNFIHNTLNECHTLHDKYIVDISRCELQIKTNMEYIKTYKVIEEQLALKNQELDIYKKYEELLKPTNLPFLVMKHLMDNITIEVNNILTEICDFNIHLNIVETPTTNNTSVIKKKLRIIIDEYSGTQKRSINSCMGSGFQKFIIDIAFRLAFIRTIPSMPKFLFIDEGFGSLDTENRELVKNALQKISSNKQYVDFIVIISHQNEFNAISNHFIRIEQLKEKTKSNVIKSLYSSVQFGTAIPEVKILGQQDFIDPFPKEEEEDEEADDNNEANDDDKTVVIKQIHKDNEVLDETNKVCKCLICKIEFVWNNKSKDAMRKKLNDHQKGNKKHIQKLQAEINKKPK